MLPPAFWHAAWHPVMALLQGAPGGEEAVFKPWASDGAVDYVVTAVYEG
ncbi:MAG: hypothetical protein QOH85_507 [Acidobacteriaceae bacterium]|jgi:hypothetical protein|nr:hypothetical protein [Acidobacteriaceae bacterium]